MQIQSASPVHHPNGATTTYFHAHCDNNNEDRPTKILDDEDHYYAPQQIGGAHVEANPAFNGHNDESHYFNPHYAPSNSSGDFQPHYYDLNVGLVPLALVDRDVHSRRVSALIAQPKRHQLPPQHPARAPSEQRNSHQQTIGRRAAQKLHSGLRIKSKLASELSQSASALYSLFSKNSEDESDRRSVASFVMDSGFSTDEPLSHYQQPIRPQQSTKMAVHFIEELSDQAAAVSDHTQRGIDFLERYGQFVKERAAIEDDYALKLRQLTKKFTSKKKDDEEWKNFSYVNTFHVILREIESLAAQHETISEKLKKEICPNVIQKCHEFRGSRKQHLQGLQALNNALTAQIENMHKNQKGYLKAFKDAENAHVKFKKADENMEMSRADVEKARQNLHQKLNICEHNKQCYADSLETANKAQRAHYQEKIPFLLEEMRKLDVDRITETKTAMNQCVDIETGVLNIIQRCYKDMRDAVVSIDPPKDTHIVVEQKKTGYAHPADFLFGDLGCPSKILQGNGESAVDAAMHSTATLKRGQLPTVAVAGKGVTRKHSMHQRIFGGSVGSNGKSNGTVSEYGSLPPQQRCRKLEQKIQEIQNEINNREQSKAGAVKMIQVYTENPKMGSASEVAQQMKQYDKEIGTLHQQLDLYNRIYSEAQREMNVPFTPIGALPQPNANASLINGASPHNQTLPPYNNRKSYSEDSVSSDGSTVMPRRLNGNTTLNVSNSHIPHIDSSAETVSNSNGSQRNVNTSSSTSAVGSTAGGDLYEDPDDHLPPLGTCKALYPFKSQVQGDGTTITMEAGEELQLLERDDGQGDGWTRVRNPRTGHEGFVPTTYIECHWFGN
ncbi:hypothetical protein M3Y98_01030300 [Aphelenchoides besseyi]|nr:hypothetical protein M3Y98_01030300 [Aphelenchoides besseyi]